MKKIFIILSIIAFLPCLSFGNYSRIIKGESSLITFNTTSAADSCVIYIGTDSTSWDVDSTKMNMVFADDSTLFTTSVTVNSYGIKWIKINYYAF